MDKASAIRLALAILGALKLVLAPFGIDIPQDVIDAIVDVVAAGFVIYTAWKNQNITHAAVQAQHYLNSIKKEKQ